MTRIRQLGTRFGILFIFLSFGCTPEMSNKRFTDVKEVNEESTYELFKDYCALSPDRHFERQAVLSAIFGNYEKSLHYATLNAKLRNTKTDIELDGIEDVNILKEELKNTIENGEPESDSVINAQYILSLVDNMGESVESIFKSQRPVSALDYISQQASEYHFLLINEAHYNSQNRVFTGKLLERLWHVGYRYLALETLNFKDTSINTRRYPIYDSGYYSRSSEYGNMMRKALDIGYTLIPYEIDMNELVNSNHPNELSYRDSIQAKNLIENTFKKDRNGKVLVHAGYDHISEAGSPTYYPLGYFIKTAIKQDILTVDQEQMCELNQDEKMHPYYQFASSNYNLTEPTVFLNENNQPLVDDIKKIGIDIQIYHPKTNFQDGLPDWRFTESSLIVPLPKSIKDQYNGHLLTAQYSHEDKNSVPVDQFIIDDTRNLLLPDKSKNYILSIINCEGMVVGQFEYK